VIQKNLKVHTSHVATHIMVCFLIEYGGYKMSFRVLIPRSIASEGIEYLEGNGCEVETHLEMSADSLKEAIKYFDAVLLRTDIMDEAVINEAKNLKIIARHGVGLDNVDIEAATNRGIYVTYTPSANINSVAEFVVGQLLSISRQIVIVDRAVREGDFNIRNTSFGTELKGKILGVVGLGNIGKLVARKCALGFDMKIIAYDPYAPTPQEDYIIKEENLEDLLRKSDFISLHLPYSKALHHIINKEKLELMKPTAFLINAARGGLIDEEALAIALKNKTIAGAALDVFEQEPTLKEHSLWGLDNVIVTPHIAGLTAEAMNVMSLECSKEIVRVKNNEEPIIWVNKKQMINI